MLYIFFSLDGTLSDEQVVEELHGIAAHGTPAVTSGILRIDPVPIHANTGSIYWQEEP